MQLHSTHMYMHCMKFIATTWNELCAFMDITSNKQHDFSWNIDSLRTLCTGPVAHVSASYLSLSLFISRNRTTAVCDCGSVLIINGKAENKNDWRLRGLISIIMDRAFNSLALRKWRKKMEFEEKNKLILVVLQLWPLPRSKHIILSKRTCGWRRNEIVIANKALYLPATQILVIYWTMVWSKPWTNANRFHVKIIIWAKKRRIRRAETYKK